MEDTLDQKDIDFLLEGLEEAQKEDSNGKLVEDAEGGLLESLADTSKPKPIRNQSGVRIRESRRILSERDNYPSKCSNIIKNPVQSKIPRIIGRTYNLFSFFSEKGYVNDITACFGELYKRILEKEVIPPRLHPEFILVALNIEDGEIHGGTYSFSKDNIRSIEEGKNVFCYNPYESTNPNFFANLLFDPVMKFYDVPRKRELEIIVEERLRGRCRSVLRFHHIFEKKAYDLGIIS